MNSLSNSIPEELRVETYLSRNSVSSDQFRLNTAQTRIDEEGMKLTSFQIKLFDSDQLGQHLNQTEKK